MIAALYCIEHKYNDSISFFHIFGSAPNGPYFKGFNGEAESTINRIPLGWKLYTEQYGLPDRVIFSTIHWDLHKVIIDRNPADLIPFTDFWNQTVETFNSNVNDRIDQILNLINVSINGSTHTINFGLRTAVWNMKGGLLLDAFNDIIRKIANNRNITLYDYDNDVHSTTKWQRNEEVETKILLRDWLHPKEVFASRAGDKMLSSRYSNYYFYRGAYSPTTPQLYISPVVKKTKPLRVQEISLISEGLGNNYTKENTGNQEFNNFTYFTIYDNHDEGWKRYQRPSINFIKSLNLGFGDILYLPSSEIEAIPLVGEVPNKLFQLDTLIAVNTNTDEYYLVRNWKYRRASKNEITNIDIILIDKIWLKYMKQTTDII